MKKLENLGKKISKDDQKKIPGGKGILCSGQWSPCGFLDPLAVCCPGLYCAIYGGDGYCLPLGQY